MRANLCSHERFVWRNWETWPTGAISLTENGLDMRQVQGVETIIIMRWQVRPLTSTQTGNWAFLQETLNHTDLKGRKDGSQGILCVSLLLPPSCPLLSASLRGWSRGKSSRRSDHSGHLLPSPSTSRWSCLRQGLPLCQPEVLQSGGLQQLPGIWTWFVHPSSPGEEN